MPSLRSVDSLLTFLKHEQKSFFKDYEMFCAACNIVNADADSADKSIRESRISPSQARYEIFP
jgi:hypothetical protein